MSRILSGEKTVEIRSRKMNIGIGTRIWLYATSPQMKIVGYAMVEQVKYEDRDELWKLFKQNMALTWEEYQIYTRRNSHVTALFIKQPVSLLKDIELDTLRRGLEYFHPPQFYMVIRDEQKFGQVLFGET